MGLFSFLKRKTKEEEPNIVKMNERINFQQLTDVNDELLTNLATKIINNEPLIASFDLLDIDEANKAMAFLSGVIYTLDGEVEQIREKTFMFANKGVYEDGSMKEFLTTLI